ncbi:MAG: NAD-binding protein [Proteobacteria bacterium]|nr:NAD-binding protein [Pseudomonadota bacterium]
MNIGTRLRFILLVILLVIVAGAGGYYHIYEGEAPLLDCFYMTVISLTSVGYGEVLPVTGNPRAEIFTMLLITFGLGIIMYGISTLTAIIVEGEVSGMLRRRQMEKRIAKLHGHYIVCGGGQTGRYVLEELLANREPAVLIEQDEARIDLCRELGEILYIQGDATDDQNLVTCGIEQARGIVVALPSDKDTLYVTMTARMLNPRARIISRMSDPKLEPKLRKAGANSVVSPNFIGGLRMASELIRPTAVSFLDQMLRTKSQTLRINEVVVSQGSSLAGRTIAQSNLKGRFGLLILGIRRPGEPEIVFNPPAGTLLAAQDTLVVMGEVDSIAKVQAVAAEKAPAPSPQDSLSTS